MRKLRPAPEALAVCNRQALKPKATEGILPSLGVIRGGSVA